MNSERHIENLALIGFMGAGKTTVGKVLARNLQFEFVDTDELVESKAGRRIKDIFSLLGEEAFRDYERQILRDLEQRHNLVIATGGGIVVNPDNMTSLKRHSLVVCLWAGAETIWERVRHQSHRPLLECPNPKERIRELLAERDPFYRQADVLINTGLRSMAEVIGQIQYQFRLDYRPERIQ